jgi:hypothetical protein
MLMVDGCTVGGRQMNKKEQEHSSNQGEKEEKAEIAEGMNSRF